MVGKGETRTFRKMYAPPARERLEPDLIDVYRFGLAKEDVAGLSPKLKQVLSFRLAPDREIKVCFNITFLSIFIINVI